jgi:hypothetical protein
VVAFSFFPPGLWIGLAIFAIAFRLSVVVWRASAPQVHP